MSNAYSYVFVRTDLTCPQQIVQAGHACMWVGSEIGPQESAVNFVLSAAKDEVELEEIAMYLEMNGIKYKIFKETMPEINGHTAICTFPLVGPERAPMRKFKLMR